MGITKIGGASYNYASYGTAKDESKAKSENAVEACSREAGAMQAKAAANGNVEGTRSKKRTAAEYTQYLQEKFSYMNKNTTMEGVPTAVSVSPAFIAKCANDPEKAKFLEENLAALPDCAKSAVEGCFGTLTNLSYSFDADGNITIAISGSSDPDGKIAAANAKRKAQEEKEATERLEEKRTAKKAEEKKATAKKASEQLTEKLMAKLEPGKNMAADIAADKEQFTISATYPVPLSSWAAESSRIDFQA